LAIAAATSTDAFEDLLAGAAAMDEHFVSTPFDSNLPVLAGLLGVWNQNFLGSGSHVVLPYDQRLHRLPAFLQQLEMESNGKSVTRAGERVTWSTGGIVWGEPGSNAQHSFFQLLHQGTAKFSADFIASARPGGSRSEQHTEALANMLAQAEAFARGRSLDDVLSEPGADSEIAAHRVHDGGRPSSIILCQAMTPHSLGALIALYEHKVYVQSTIWGINAFDQWGVELGKKLAGGMRDILDGNSSAANAPGIASIIRDWT
jgi:glucose-6-phosphate isomerase